MSSNRRHAAVVALCLWFDPGTGTGSIRWDSGPINGQIPVLPPKMSAGMFLMPTPTRTRNNLLNDTRTRRPN